jgi:hypothetical protein
MNTSWEIVILDALEALDRKEGPHGLYGIRQANSSGGQLPKLAHLLSSTGKTGILRSSGFRSIQTRYSGSDLWFSTGTGECIILHVLDHATTKVRQYGSAYRLDAHHPKAAKEPGWQLESLVPKLSTRGDTVYTRGLLLVAHFRTEKDLGSMLGRSTKPDFLGRYQIRHFARDWQDRYGRDFRTAIHLWIYQKRPVKQ